MCSHNHVHFNESIRSNELTGYNNSTVLLTDDSIGSYETFDSHIAIGSNGADESNGHIESNGFILV